jgi:hypothetical protein
MPKFTVKIQAIEKAHEIFSVTNDDTEEHYEQECTSIKEVE